MAKRSVKEEQPGHEPLEPVDVARRAPEADQPPGAPAGMIIQVRSGGQYFLRPDDTPEE